MAFNVIYIGNNARVCDYIHCHDAYEVKAVICQDFMVNEDLLTCIYLRNIKLIEIKDYEDLKNAVSSVVGVDFCIMFSFALILKNDLLSKIKVYNIHTSRLPLYKGRHPTFYATMAGDTKIGMSLHEVIPQIDRGKIISQQEVIYYYWMGELALSQQLEDKTPFLLNDLNLFLTDDSFATTENASGNYDAPVSLDMLVFNNDTPISHIMNLCRTQERYKGAIFKFAGKEYRVKRTKVSLLTTKVNFTQQENVLFFNNSPVGIKINERHFLEFAEPAY